MEWLIKDHLFRKCIVTDLELFTHISTLDIVADCSTELLEAG